MTNRGSSSAKHSIAHRGASAYAPEHTLEAYELAIEQGADFIEPDLQITRDGVLVCLHDLTLERTTNVAEVFRDRYREEDVRGRQLRRWYVSDFDLVELHRLDAGSWFDNRFAGARVPTLEETIEIARGRAGIYPETKAPEVYGHLGFAMERLLIEVLERYALARVDNHARTPVVIQSFSAESLQILRSELESELPLVYLVSEADESLSAKGLAKVATFATGLGPDKRLLLEDPDLAERAHEAGLSVVPWTFRSDDPGAFADVREEMAYFLYDMGVDALFTNNPDLFPR